MTTICRSLVTLLAWLLLTASTAYAQSPQVVDVPSRPDVTQRILIITPDKPKAAVILFAGGDGGLTLEADGRIPKLGGNFLMRSWQLFVDQDLTTVVIDAPSDKQSYPFYPAIARPTTMSPTSRP